MPRILGEVRRSQIVTTYGVGAIVPIEDESFMIAGLDRWDDSDTTLWIHEPRLEQTLNVRHLLLPPASDDDLGQDIPVVRFPTWYFCPSCEELGEHGRFTTFDKNYCNTCGSGLVPSRFVTVCDNGHIDDFPYANWVHGIRGLPAGTHRLSISNLGVTASLGDILIICSCGQKRTMEGAFARNALRRVQSCTGFRPWLSSDRLAGCKMAPRVLQRGASNVWFPIVSSALSIPPWSEDAFKALNRHWDVLRHIPEDSVPLVLEGMKLAGSSEFTVEDLVLAIRQRKETEASGAPPAGLDLKEGEYEALSRGREQKSGRQDFVCVPATDVSAAVASVFDKVMVAKRLREVRALASFTRLREPEIGDDPGRRAPLSDEDLPWRPAIEVIGEGVFLRLDEMRVRSWEATAGVADRAKILEDNARRRQETKGGGLVPQVPARFLLVHSLAHILINQWALDCGYPAASLRERLFVSEEYAALLIYTATSDSAGSLGGVVGQADPIRLEAALRDGVRRAGWCSGDPLCFESDPGGTDALNLAACHACALLPETSCEHANVLLDRAMLIGVAGQFEGFFAGWLD